VRYLYFDKDDIISEEIIDNTFDNDAGQFPTIDVIDITIKIYYTDSANNITYIPFDISEVSFVKK
jgi:hypothetical protein